MSNCIIFNLGASPQNVNQYLPDVDDPLYNKLPNALLRADLSALTDISGNPTTPTIYWKVINYVSAYAGQVVVMTAPEQAAVDAANAAIATAQEQSEAISDVNAPIDQMAVIRAVLDQIAIQLNNHTQWEAAFVSAVANAATLAALKTAVAAITPVTTITLANAKAAVIADIQSGNVS